MLKAGMRADLIVASDDIVSDPGALDRGALLEVIKDGVGHRGLAGVPQRTVGDSIDAREKPMNPKGLRRMLTPPTRAVDDSPRRMLSQASCNATMDDEHAVSTDMLGPRRSRQ